MIESALEWQLKLLKWQFFVTLTWDSVEATTVISRRRNVERWLEHCCNVIAHMHKSDCAYVIRWERGELSDRPHCHLLITAFPQRVVYLTSVFRMAHMWKHEYKCACQKPQEQHCSHGIGQVRLYEPSRNGEAYMAKGKFSYTWAQGANAYELKKFNAVELDALYISPRAKQMMTAKRGGVGDEMLHLA